VGPENGADVGGKMEEERRAGRRVESGEKSRDDGRGKSGGRSSNAIRVGISWSSRRKAKRE
jgi:hypothetical protein